MRSELLILEHHLREEMTICMHTHACIHAYTCTWSITCVRSWPYAYAYGTHVMHMAHLSEELAKLCVARARATHLIVCGHMYICRRMHLQWNHMASQ